MFTVRCIWLLDVGDRQSLCSGYYALRADLRRLAAGDYPTAVRLPFSWIRVSEQEDSTDCGRCRIPVVIRCWAFLRETCLMEDYSIPLRWYECSSITRYCLLRLLLSIRTANSSRRSLNYLIASMAYRCVCCSALKCAETTVQRSFGFVHSRKQKSCRHHLAGK